MIDADFINTQDFVKIGSIKFDIWQVFCEPSDTVALGNFPGNALRGAFGYAFKNAVCIFRKSTCESCEFREKCSYSAVFSNKTDSSRDFTKMYFFEGNGKEPYYHTEPFSFKLGLFSAAMKVAPYIVATLIKMGRAGVGIHRGKFRITGIVSLAWGIEVYNAEGNYINLELNSPTFSSFLHEEKIKDKVLVEFVTPVTIKKQGRYLFSPLLEDLYIAVIRRIKQLYFIQFGKPIFLEKTFERDGAYINSIKTAIKHIRRYSARQEYKSISFSGFVGKMTVEQLSPWNYYLLKLGELMHIGKGTTMGLGKYIVNAVSDER